MYAKKIFSIVTACTLVLAASSLKAAETTPTIGVVDFMECVQTSQYGKKEQESMETLRNQIQKAMEDLDSQINEIAKKLQDPDQLDALSPEAETELRVKMQTLSEEMNRSQNRYMQVMQQANMRFAQMMQQLINTASETVAKDEKLSLILNKEVTCHFASSHDVTDKVILQLDKNFEQESKYTESASK